MAQRIGYGLPVYKGKNVYGYGGVGGSLTGNIMRYALPLIKPIAKQLFTQAKKKAITAGMNVARDVFIKKQPLKKSVKKRGRQAVKSALKRRKGGVKRRGGQKGRGICSSRSTSARRGIKRKNTTSSSNSAKKRKRTKAKTVGSHKDIFA